MEAGDDASQITVGRSLGVAPATMSESVQLHVQKGLLEQVPSTTDRRVRILRLTPSAQEVMGKLREVLRASEETLVRGLTDSECNFIAAELDRVIANLDSSAP